MVYSESVIIRTVFVHKDGQALMQVTLLVICMLPCSSVVTSVPVAMHNRCLLFEAIIVCPALNCLEAICCRVIEEYRDAPAGL